MYQLSKNQLITELLYKIYEDDRFLNSDRTYTYAIEDAMTMNLIERGSGKLALTEKGLWLVKSGKTFDDYLKEGSSGHTTIHIKDNINTVIGNKNTQSSRDITHQAQSNPTNSPMANANKSHKNKSMRSIFIGVIVGIILIIITVSLRACGVHAAIRF